jgi:hypothetical protein
MRYVPALTLGGEATVKQRARNFALYKRLENGDGTGDYKSSGLAGFVYEVPVDVVTRGGIGGRPPCYSFRIDKDSECFRRLLHVISDHFDAKCDADDEAARLRAALQAIVDAVDFTAGACRITEQVGAVLPPVLIENARKALQP